MSPFAHRSASIASLRGLFGLSSTTTFLRRKKRTNLFLQLIRQRVRTSGWRKIRVENFSACALDGEALRHVVGAGAAPLCDKQGISTTNPDIHEIGWLIRHTVPNQSFPYREVAASRNRVMVSPLVPIARHDVTDLLMAGMVRMNQSPT